MSRMKVVVWLVVLVLAACNLSQSDEPTPTLPTETPATLSCDTLVTRALEKANQSCNMIGRNQACYGNNLVRAEFQPNITLSFANSGDVVDVSTLRQLTTAPLDETQGTWGIALLKVQANLADTLPGQNVTFLLFGNAVLDNISPTMQAVVLKTGIASTTCESVPKSALMLQSPEGTQATMNINGASVTLGSTAYLTAEENSELTIATIEGSAIVSASNITRIVQPGAQVRLPLGGTDGLQVSGPPSEPEPYEIQEVIQAPLPLLERLVQVPQPIAPAPTSTSVPVQATTVCVPRQDWNFSYRVQAGQTLFQIAQLFGVSVNELQQANCITNPNQIQVGQQLRVPRQLATAVPSATVTTQATETLQPTLTSAPTAINPNLRADQSTINAGECTTIRWDVTNVSQVYFQGQPARGNSQEVCPTSDTTYTLLLVYENGQQAPFSVRVQVIVPQVTDDPDKIG